MKKVIIAGTRTLNVGTSLIASLFKHFQIPMNVQIVSGAASGVDESGEKFARENALEVQTFPADWSAHGKAAGPIRNKQMAEYADALLLIWNGESSGSMNMQQEMLRRGKKVFEVILTRS